MHEKDGDFFKAAFYFYTGYNQPGSHEGGECKIEESKVSQGLNPVGMS